MRATTAEGGMGGLALRSQCIIPSGLFAYL